MNLRKGKKGFTIVELLIVIVVIGILAAIALVAYSGVQTRSRDTVRKTHVAAMQKALSLYKIDNGVFPATVPNPGNSTWEISTDPGFLNSLKPSYLPQSPVDPKPTSLGYWYHTFNAGDYGCSASLGAYYVIWLRGMESQSATYLNNDGCTTQTLIVAPNATNLSYAFYFGFN